MTPAQFFLDRVLMVEEILRMENDKMEEACLTLQSLGLMDATFELNANVLPPHFHRWSMFSFLAWGLVCC